MEKEVWIKHDGKSQPRPFDAEVEVITAGGETYKGLVMDHHWQHDGEKYDIVEYRFIQPLWAGTEASTNPKQSIGMSKLPLHLVSPLAIAYMAVGLANGAEKYGISNYKGTEVIMSIYLAAIQRHLMAIMEGEEFDPVDGSPHWGAVLANAAIILEARAVGKLIDDRPITGGYLKEVEGLTKIYQNLVELHKDKKPFHYTRNNVDAV